MRRRTTFTARAIAVWTCAAASPVFAHAFLDHATPAVGSTVDSAPPAVELWFTEDVEESFCSVELFDRSTHQRIDTRPMEHPKPDTLVVPLPSLAPGEYEVHWKVVSVDTHPTEGSFHFRFTPR